MTTATPAPTAAPAPSPAPAAATKPRAPRDVPVHIATVTLDLPTSDGEGTESRSASFVVYGTEAQAEAALLARVATFVRATPQHLIDAGRNGFEILKPAAGGEGGAA